MYASGYYIFYIVKQNCEILLQLKNTTLIYFKLYIIPVMAMMNFQQSLL